MGASLIGGECARAIWYGFHWVTKPRFSGQTLRLFNRGHLEEGRFIALLLMINCQVFQQDEHGKQYRISHAEGHFGGSGDGVVVGLPDLQPGIPALSEFKTHGEKSFVALAGKNWRKYVKGLLEGKPIPFEGEGVRLAKFEHYVQMQTYMRKMGLAVALYVAVNKNTDDIYMELVPLDTATADQFLDRGEKLVWMQEPPKKLNSSPGFFGCTFCDHKPVCHKIGKAVPEVNCRTCTHSAPVAGAEWMCKVRCQTIPKEVQLTGCPSYERNPVI